MGLQNRMAERKSADNTRKNVEFNLAKNSKEYRSRKLLEAWSRVPEVK